MSVCAAPYAAPQEAPRAEKHFPIVEDDFAYSVDEIVYLDESTRTVPRCTSPLNPDGTVCQELPASLMSVPVPRFAAPFQVQIVSMPSFLPDDYLTETFPEQPLWELRHVCGGSLIAPDWVLTAAHCIRKNAKRTDYGVRIDVDNIAQTASEAYGIREIILHEDYNKTGNMENDIALLHLDITGANLVVAPFVPWSRGLNNAVSIRNAELLASGTRLLTYGSDFKSRLWDTANGRALAAQPSASGRMQSRGEAPDSMAYGNYVYGLKGQAVTAVDIQTGRQAASFAMDGTVSGYLFRADLGRLAMWDDQRRITIWDLSRSGAPLTILHPRQVLQVVMPQKDKVLIRDRSGVIIYDLGSQGQPVASVADVWSLVMPRAVNGGRGMLVLTDSGLVYMDVETGRNSAPFGPKASAFTRASPDEQLLTGRAGHIALHKTAPGRFDVWDMKTGQRTAQISTSTDLRYIHYDAAHARFLAWSKDGAGEIWNVRTGRRLLTLSLESSKRPISMQLFDEGKELLVAYPRGLTQILNAKTGRVLRTIDHSLPTSFVRLSQDERHLFSGSEFGMAEVWDAKTGKEVVRLFHGGPVSGLAFYNNNALLVTWGLAGKTRLWDVATQTELQRVIHGDQSGGAAAFRNPGNAKPALVSTIALSRDVSDVNPDTTLTTFGWGKTREIRDYDPSPVLRVLALREIDRATCLEKGGWPESYLPETKTAFCAYDPRRKTCYGDSGGPVIGADRVVGIVSAGTEKCREDDSPSIYTRVSFYEKWVQGHVCPRTPSGTIKPPFCD